MKLLYVIQVALLHILTSLIIGITTDHMSYRFWSWVLIALPINLLLASLMLPKRGDRIRGKTKSLFYHQKKSKQNL